MDDALFKNYRWSNRSYHRFYEWKFSLKLYIEMRLLLLLTVLSLLLLHIHLTEGTLDEYASADGIEHAEDDLGHAVNGVELQQQDESVFNLMKAQVMNDLKLVGMLIPPQVKTYVTHVYDRMRSDGKHIIQGLVGEMLSTLGRLGNRVSAAVITFGEKMKENSEKQIKNDEVEASDEIEIEIEYAAEGHQRYVNDEERDEDEYDIVEI